MLVFPRFKITSVYFLHLEKKLSRRFGKSKVLLGWGRKESFPEPRGASQQYSSAALGAKTYEIESDDAVEIRGIGGEFGTRNESHILEEVKKDTIPSRTS